MRAGKSVGYRFRGARATARGSAGFGRWVTRRVSSARARGGAGEIGMMRLLDLHAASCAGDTLVTMGLAGTVFFNVSAGEARGRVALYLLLTMAPFALLAPIVGPVLDRFRHGRRYALAATMLGRAFLAWLISDYINSIGLYPVAFGVLVLSRAYGVARSAAVPRLLPDRIGLSEAGARASVWGTVAGAVVAPLGIAAFWFGPQWPLRVASVIFVAGMVVSLRLPPRADSDPPETVPALSLLPGRREKVLTGRLVFSALFGGVVLRGLYGFLALFLAFAVRSGNLPTRILGLNLQQAAALGVVAAGLGAGTFLATAVGTRLRIRRPALLQAGALSLLAAVALLAAGRYTLATVTALCLATAVASGLAKLALDATIQERIPEGVRASAFAHSETALMLAWVLGGAVGLIPFPGHAGVILAAVVVILAAVRGVLSAARLRRERLHGAAAEHTRDPIGEPATRDLSDVTTRDLGRVRSLPRWTRMRSAKAEHAGRQRRSGDGLDTPSTVERTATLPTVVQRSTMEQQATTRTMAWDEAQPPPGRAGQDQDVPGYHLYRPGGGQPAAADGDEE